MKKAKILISVVALVVVSILTIIFYSATDDTGIVYIREKQKENKLLLSDGDVPFECARNKTLTRDAALQISYRIKKELKRLQKQKVPEQNIDFLAYISGVGVPEARVMREGFSTPITLPPFTIKDAELATIEAEKSLSHFISTGDLSFLQKVVQSGVIKDDFFYAGQKQMMFIYSKVLSSSLEPDFYIRELLDVGLAPKLSDLIYATQRGIDTTLLETMYHKADFNAEDTFFHLGTYQSLTTQALFGGHYEQALYWIEQGSPLEPDSMFLNAFDIIALSSKNFTNEQLISLSGIFLKKGLKPNLLYSFNLLSSKLSNIDIGFEQNFGLPKSIVEASDALLVPFYEYTLAPLNWRSDDYKESISCFKKLSYEYVKLTMKIINEPNNSEPSSLSAENKKQLEDSASSLLTRFGSVKSAEQYLGRYQTIDAKQKIYVLRYEQMKILAKEALKQFNELENRKEIEDRTKKILTLINSEKWSEALTLLESSDDIGQEFAPTTLLALSIGKQPPIDFVELLLEKGARLAESSIMELAKTDDADLARFLLSKGLKINYSDSLGNTPLIIAVQNKSLNMLDFLLSVGAGQSQDELGFDALDYALKNFKLDSPNKQIINSLITHDFPIEDSHRQWVDFFIQKNLATYAYLVNTYPILKVE